MKAVLHYRASRGFQQQLAESAKLAGLSTVVVDEADVEGFAHEMADADILLHILTPVTAAHIAAAPRLKLIQKIGVGVNTIDLEAARAHNVAVANMPGTNSQAVAELALALMLATLRRLNYFDALTRANQGWSPDLTIVDQVGEISGKTVGLIGFGGIPAILAPVLTTLGATVLYTARTERDGSAAQFCDLDTLLERSDIVSLHVPLTSDTHHLIDRPRIARMKEGAILINTARGNLVDEAALIEALERGHLRGAGMDVFETEPISSNSPLFQRPEITMTPHMAWLTRETLERSLGIAMENVRRIAAGAPLLHRVV